MTSRSSGREREAKTPSGRLSTTPTSNVDRLSSKCATSSRGRAANCSCIPEPPAQNSESLRLAAWCIE